MLSAVPGCCRIAPDTWCTSFCTALVAQKPMATCPEHVLHQVLQSFTCYMSPDADVTHLGKLSDSTLLLDRMVMARSANQGAQSARRTQIQTTSTAWRRTRSGAQAGHPRGAGLALATVSR
jgi:hypothetical protein